MEKKLKVKGEACKINQPIEEVNYSQVEISKI